MASDETPPADGPQPFQRPARERHREPPVIDATAEAVGEPQAESAPADKPVEEPAAPASRRTPFPTLPFAVAVALILSLGATYLAWQQSESSTAPNQELSRLQSRLDKLEATPPAVTPDQLSALEKRVASLEQRPAPTAPSSAASSAAPPAALVALDSRLTAAEKLAREAATAAANRPAPPAPEPAPRVDLSPLENRVATLEQQLSAPKTEVRATEDPSATPDRSSDRTALAVVTQALAEAVTNGRPYSLELTAAEALGADAGQLKALQPFAKSGAPTRDALARSFAQVSPKVLAASAPSTAGQGLTDRLMAGAARLVRIRPVGEAAGEDAPALIARIEAALARGDIPAARRDWERLPEPARAQGAPFADLLQQRSAAEGAAQSLRDSAMAALARPKD